MGSNAWRYEKSEEDDALVGVKATLTNGHLQMNENRIYGYIQKLGFSQIYIANEEDDCKVIGRLKKTLDK